MLKIEPETLRKKYPNLSENEYNFIQATLTVKNTNYPFEDWYAFENVVWALNNQIPNFKVLDPPPVKYIWKAIFKMKELRPKMDFSDEVKTYVKVVSNNNDIIFYPPVLELHVDFTDSVINRASEILSGSTSEENVLDIQAARYLAIKQYLENNK